MRILIIEDIAMVRKMLEALLKPYGECTSVKDGKRGLEEYLRSQVAEEPYDLICLDMMLPEMSGIDVLRNIRDTEEQDGIDKEYRIKILVITAINKISDVYDTLHEGCDGYIAKPFDRKKLYGEMERLGFFPNI
jgi:two-component system chemotaxis response regulator CheY